MVEIDWTFVKLLSLDSIWNSAFSTTTVSLKTSTTRLLIRILQWWGGYHQFLRCSPMRSFFSLILPPVSSESLVCLSPNTWFFTYFDPSVSPSLLSSLSFLLLFFKSCYCSTSWKVPQNSPQGKASLAPTPKASVNKATLAPMDQEPGTRDQEPGTRDQGPGARDQGPGTRDQT